jgi:hypothetical protein
MNEQEYQAARGELQRLEAAEAQAGDRRNRRDLREIMDSLRRDIEAFEAGERGATPSGGHGD